MSRLEVRVFEYDVQEYLGDKLGLIDENEHAMLWVTDWPMFEYNEDEGISRIRFCIHVSVWC